MTHSAKGFKGFTDVLLGEQSQPHLSPIILFIYFLFSNITPVSMFAWVNWKPS